MHDLHNTTRTARVIDPIAIGANATKSGKVVDRQGYGGVEFVERDTLPSADEIEARYDHAAHPNAIVNASK